MRVLNAPSGIALDILQADDDKVGPLLLFVKNTEELRAKGEPLFTAALADRIVWIAYPKSGQLGTDLNRDKLWKMVEEKGIRPVRQVSIDDAWSALRFRPK